MESDSMSQTRSVLVLLLACMASGCNELQVGSKTVGANAPFDQSFNLPFSLKLDAGVEAGGVENIIDVQAPLILESCTFIASMTNPTMSAIGRKRAPDGTLLPPKVFAVAKDITTPWSDSTSLYYCSFTLPAGTPAGDLTVTPSHVVLSDPKGHTIDDVRQKAGVVHVIS
jgi:hypothetical protein